MELPLSWAYVLAAIASLVEAVRTGQYVLLLGIPIAIGALFTVSFAPSGRLFLQTASRDPAIARPVRAIAGLVAKLSPLLPLLWPVAFLWLILTDHFVGAWLVDTYIVASNTIRWYRAEYLPSATHKP